jgi:hypothetical protein
VRKEREGKTEKGERRKEDKKKEGLIPERTMVVWLAGLRRSQHFTTEKTGPQI